MNGMFNLRNKIEIELELREIEIEKNWNENELVYYVWFIGIKFWLFICLVHWNEKLIEVMNNEIALIYKKLINL